MTIALAPPRVRSCSACVDGADITCIGALHDAMEDPCAAIARAVLAGGIFRSNGNLSEALRSLRGNFAFVVRDRSGQVLASADKVKSYPISYTHDRDGTLHVAWNADVLCSVAVPSGTNDAALLEFAMAGHVTNGETLIAGIRQLRGGEALLASRDGAYTLFDWYHFFDSGVSHRSRADLVEDLRVRTRDIFERLAARLNGRTALIPLSGGYDSRLVVTMLRAVGYERIRTFSYGIPGNCEAAAARVIAERLGVPWTFVPYTRAFGRSMYRTKERRQYFAFAHQFAAIPMMTDFYAFCDLSRRHVLPDDAVVINGQTGDFISGGHIPAVCMDDVVTRRAWLDAILAKHYSLWAHLRTPANDAAMDERILRSLPVPVPERMSRDDAMKRYECWEWRARQCEHVVAGQRTYDFFGLPWELPLWDDAYLDFWASLPCDAKFRQSLYLEYLKTHDRFALFQRPFRRYTPPWSLHLVSESFRIFGRHGDTLRRQYLHYWQKYAYFYAIYSYRQYRRFARDHRNPSACIAREVLRELHDRSVAALQ